MLIELLNEFKWVLHVILAIGLLWIADKLLGLSPTYMFRALASEARDLASANITVGGVNFLALLILATLGILIVLLGNEGVIGRIISGLFGEGRAEEFSQLANFWILFSCIAVVAVVSVWSLSRVSR